MKDLKKFNKKPHDFFKSFIIFCFMYIFDLEFVFGIQQFSIYFLLTLLINLLIE